MNAWLKAIISIELSKNDQINGLKSFIVELENKSNRCRFGDVILKKFKRDLFSMTRTWPKPPLGKNRLRKEIEV